MMIQSMTGYGRHSRHAPFGAVTVELRSTNHRYLEIGQRLPEWLVGFESEVAQLIKRHIRRGRIDVTVTVQTPRAASRRVVVDEALAQAYHTSLLELKSRFGLKGAVTLDQLLSLPILSVADEPALARQALWPSIRQAIASALQGLLAMRRAEGHRLLRDIRAHVRLIHTRLVAIRARLPRSLSQQKRRLQERLKLLFGAAPPVTSAQIQEALALIKDVDIHEELVRLESHLTHIRQALERRDSVGKKLDFIAQELMREANTVGAKTNDAAIAHHVIDIKGAIEKIREQAQNLE